MGAGRDGAGQPEMANRFERPTRRVTIRREWFVLSERRSMRFWGAVAKRVRERRVRHADLDAVMSVVMEVENVWRE